MKKDKNANGIFVVILIAILVFITLGFRLYQKHQTTLLTTTTTLSEITLKEESQKSFKLEDITTIQTQASVTEIEGSTETEEVSIPIGSSSFGKKQFRYFLSERDVVKVDQDGNEDIFRVPSNAKYVGISDRNGLVFFVTNEDSSTEVLLLDFGFNEFKTIAINVKEILDLDYKYSDKLWAEPLFLMQDGHTMVYLDGNLHLVDNYENNG